MKYEREVIQEIWRTSRCTFNVVYLTNELVGIKGMRGELSRRDLASIVGILAREGYKEILYDRMINGVLVSKATPLLEKYKKYKGSFTILRGGKCSY